VARSAASVRPVRVARAESFEKRITFKVTSCSDYVDQSVPSYWELMHQAWILRPESGKRPAGFVRASDLRDEEYSRDVSGLGKHPDE